MCFLPCLALCALSTWLTHSLASFRATNRTSVSPLPSKSRLQGFRPLGELFPISLLLKWRTDLRVFNQSWRSLSKDSSNPIRSQSGPQSPALVRPFLFLDSLTPIHLHLSRGSLSQFNLSLNADPRKVMGRVLDAPKIHYGNSGTVFVRDGSWKMAEKKTRFLIGSRLDSFAVIIVGPQSRDHPFAGFLLGYLQQAFDLG